MNLRANLHMYLEKNSRKILRCRLILKRSCKILAALLAVHAIGLCLDYAYVDVSPTIGCCGTIIMKTGEK